jgi:hypothetical protein
MLPVWLDQVLDSYGLLKEAGLGDLPHVDTDQRNHCEQRVLVGSGGNP